MEKQTDIIRIESGYMFEGTRELFRNCYFDNATNEEILSWCKQSNMTFEVNNTLLYDDLKSLIGVHESSAIETLFKKYGSLAKDYIFLETDKHNFVINAEII